MIVADITKDGVVLMTRLFDDPARSLNSVVTELEAYVVAEQLNLGSECVLRARRVRHSNPLRQARAATA